MRNQLLPLLLLISTAGTGSPARAGNPPNRSTPGCANVLQDVEKLVQSPPFANARVGLQIADLSSGHLLYEFNADAKLVPASNVKVVSTAAALHHLGADYRFVTRVHGKLDDRGQVSGALYVRGNGDPWLVPERVWQLASKLYFSGVRQIRGDIIVDDSYFAGPRLANGWEQDSSSAAYMAPTGATSVGFNVVMVHVYPGRSTGDPAKVLVQPASDYAKIENSATTGGRRSRLSIDVVPDGNRSIIRVSGRISPRDENLGYYRRIDNPPVHSGEVLRAALKQVGIRVRGRVREGRVPEELPVIAQIGSLRLVELVNRVNKHSNNFMAEQIALAMGAEIYGAPATWEKSRAAIDTFLVGEVGLAPDSYEIENASGLHDVNRFSPSQLVAVLAHMYRHPRLRPEYLASLAVASSSGTLTSRMRETEAEGLLRGKTGTLSIASALSGYVTARSGEPLAFSILVNDYANPVGEVLGIQDQIGAALATYDSSCQPALHAGIEGRARPVPMALDASKP